MFLTDGQADAQAMMQEILLKMLNKGIHFSSSADAKAWLILSAYKMRRKAMKAYVALARCFHTTRPPQAKASTTMTGSGKQIQEMKGKLPPAHTEPRDT